jgi:hypothetical protein
MIWRVPFCLEKLTSTWNQRISSVQNSLHEMMETLHFLSSTLGQENEQQKWLTIRAKAETFYLPEIAFMLTVEAISFPFEENIFRIEKEKVQHLRLNAVLS